MDSLRYAQCRQTVERGKSVVRQNQVKSTLLEGVQECRLSLNACWVAGDTIGFQGCLNEFRVLRLVFKMENSQRTFRRHSLFLSQAIFFSRFRAVAR